MLGVLITFLFSVGAAGIGLFALRRLTEGFDPAARLALSGLVGLAILGLLTLPIGLLPEGLHWGLPVVGILSGLGWLNLIRDRKSVFSGLTLPKGAWLLAPAVLAVAWLFSLLGVVAPSITTDWDSLAYHLAVPKLWLAAGRITFVSYIHHSNFPLTVDNLYIWGLSWGGQQGAKAFSLVYSVLASVAIFGLARMRYGQAAAWASSLAFATIPVVVWLGGTAYIDVANGAFAGLGILFAAWLIAEPEERRYGWLSAIFLGFAAGSKYTGLQTIAVAGFMILAFGVVRKQPKEGFSAAVRVALVAMAICAPWYVRNVINTGNPVYPFFYSVLGGKNWSDYNAFIYNREQQTFGAGRAMETPEQPDYTKNPLDPTRLGHAVLGLSYQPGRYINPAPTKGGGLVFGCLGVTAVGAWLLWMSSGRMRRFETAVVAMVGLSLLMWFVLSEQARYIIALGVPLSVLFGGGVTRLRFGIGLAGLGVVQAGLGLYVIQASLVMPEAAVVQGKVSPEEYQRTIGFYDSAQILNRIVPKDGRVALYDEVFGFLLDVPYFWANPGHTTELGYDRMNTGDDLADALKAHGMTHVYFDLNLSDRNFGPTWVAAAGLSGSVTPFPADVRQTYMADIGAKWKILLAEAIGSGRLRLVDATRNRLIFEIVR